MSAVDVADVDPVPALADLDVRHDCIRGLLHECFVCPPLSIVGRDRNEVEELQPTTPHGDLPTGLRIIRARRAFAEMDRDAAAGNGRAGKKTKSGGE